MGLESIIGMGKGTSQTATSTTSNMGSSSGGMLDNDTLTAGLLFGPVGYGFAGQTKNANKAADAREAGMRRALARAEGIDRSYDEYIAAGSGANKALGRLFEDPSYIKELPGYQFRYDEGIRGTTNKYSQKGGIFSGEAMKALVEFSQGYASAEYDKEYQRLYSQQKLGLEATAGKQGAVMNLAEMEFGLGQAQASRYDQRSAILAGEIGFGRQIFGQWSGAFAGASASSMGGGMGG